MPRTKKMGANAGFTLLEVVVTMAIMALILSLTLVSFNSIRSSSGVKLATETLSSDLRAAAQNALGSEDLQAKSPDGWGIYFDHATQSYTLFADFDGDHAYDSNEKFRTVDLEGKARLVRATFDSSHFNTNYSLFFLRRTAATYFNNNPVTPGNGPVVIEVSNEVDQGTKNITVNSFGVVDIE